MYSRQMTGQFKSQIFHIDRDMNNQIRDGLRDYINKHQADRLMYECYKDERVNDNRQRMNRFTIQTKMNRYRQILLLCLADDLVGVMFSVS